MDHMFSISDRSKEQAGQERNSPDVLRTFEHCGLWGIAHYNVLIWQNIWGSNTSEMKFRLISSPAIRSCRVRQLTPIPTQTMILGAGPVWRCITQQLRSLSPRVSKLESDHRDIAGKIDIRK
ncbi:hypothetical protein TNCV_3592131 [Trichonephila clavipes]|nr:hypothetical protein TNCV_3592131 [Trichonephila clavipes]